MLLILLIALVVAINATLFAIQNNSIIIVNFYSWKFEGSLAVVLILTFCIGVFTGLLAAVPNIIKKSKIIINQKDTIEKLKDEKEKEFEEETEVTT